MIDFGIGLGYQVLGNRVEQIEAAAGAVGNVLCSGTLGRVQRTCDVVQRAVKGAPARDARECCTGRAEGLSEIAR